MREGEGEIEGGEEGTLPSNTRHAKYSLLVYETVAEAAVAVK